MLGIEQYHKLQEYRKLGISKLKVSEILDLSYKTVSNWWEKSEDVFYSFQSEHEFMLDNYRQFIVEILKVCPQINNTVLLRRVKDNFKDFSVPNSTFFRYVKKVRDQTGFAKPQRKYALREETKPGYEAQVDFGQYVMKTMYGRNIRIYFFCMTLSYSRMKYVYFSADPFNIQTVITAHNYAFKYFGGRTQVVVYDQNKTMIVSENFGDVIFVKEFEDFIKETGYSVYLCRGYDPESKGKIEKTIDFIKHLFLDGRIYSGIDNLNAESMMWLDREGNGFINDTTKKIPRELFKNEAPLLIKVYEKKSEEVIVTSVTHEIVMYKNVRYKLPSSLVHEGDRVRIEKHDDNLIIYHALTNEIIYKHRILSGIGGIVPCVEVIKHIPSIEEELLAIFKTSQVGIEFIQLMRKQKPRYVYPQCRRLNRMRKYYSDKQLLDGMAYCLKTNTATIFELCSYLLFKYGEEIAKKYVPPQTYRHYHDRAIKIMESYHG